MDDENALWTAARPGDGQASSPQRDDAVDEHAAKDREVDLMDAGAELAELDAAALTLEQVGVGLGAERARCQDVLGALLGAAGLVPARRACDDAGEALVPGLVALRRAAEVLAVDAAGQAFRFRRADGVR